MSPYNAYSSSLSSSRLSSYTPSIKYSGSTGYSTLSSTYKYKPPAYSSTLSSKYRSPSTYTSYTPRTYTSSTLTRNLSSSYLSTRSPKFNSVSSYESAITSSNDWKSSADVTTERLWRSPSLSLSRRNSSSSLASSPRTPDRIPRPSLPTCTTLSNSNIAYIHGSSSSSLNEASIGRPRKIGLNNLGNTCFMNAVLQCLLNTKPLRDYFLSENCLKDINPRSPSRGDLVRVFKDFVKKMTSRTDGAAFSAYDLRREVQRYAPRFMGDNQHDAQEFLRYLLQGLHDDLNQSRHKPTGKLSDSERDAVTAWRNYKETDDSIISDTFAGLLKSTLSCTICHRESVTFDPFLDISLPLPENVRETSLRECIRLFTSPELLDGMNRPFCEQCKLKTTTSKKIDIEKLPKILVIHFKRFSNYDGTAGKLNTVIQFPKCLGNYSDLGATKINNFLLYGIVDHNGTSNSGHYIAKCRENGSEEWLEYNDSRVDKIADPFSKKNTYILFYKNS